jgi:hypothetical protein
MMACLAERLDIEHVRRWDNNETIAVEILTDAGLDGRRRRIGFD